MKIHLNRFLKSIIPAQVQRYALFALWLGLTISFGSLALASLEAMNSKVPRAGFRIPTSRNIPAGNLRFQEVVNGLANSYDATMFQLEQAMQRSARNGFWMNLSSAVLCLAGAIAQWMNSRSSLLRKDHQKQDNPFRAASFPTLAPMAGQGPLPAPVVIHNGSFPDGGYAH